MIGKRFVDQRKKIDIKTFVDRTSVQVLRVSSVPAGVDVAPFSFPNDLAMERLRSSRVVVILSVTAPRPTSRWRDRLSKTLSDTPSNLFARTFVCRIWVFSICSELSNAFEMSFALALVHHQESCRLPKHKWQRSHSRHQDQQGSL